jgi:hypothetical protein
MRADNCLIILDVKSYHPKKSNRFERGDDHSMPPIRAVSAGNSLQSFPKYEYVQVLLPKCDPFSFSRWEPGPRNTLDR